MRGSSSGQPQQSPLRGHMSQLQQPPGGFQLPKLPANFPQMVPQGPPQGPAASWDTPRLPGTQSRPFPGEFMQAPGHDTRRGMEI